MSHIQELTNKIAELSVAGFVTERASVHGGGFYVLCPDMSRHDVIFDHEDDAYQQLGILRAQAIMALLVSVNRQRIERPIATAECFSSHRTGTLRDMTRDKIASVIGFQANRAGCSKTGMEWAFTYKGHKCAIWSYKGSQQYGEFSTFGPSEAFAELFGVSWTSDL